MKRFTMENTVLNVAYTVIDGLKVACGPSEILGAHLASATRSLAPAIAVTYVFGEACATVFHKVRHRLEDALAL